MGYYLAASPSPTVSSRGAFWPPHCSPASSASYPEGQKKTYSSPHINIDGTTLNAVERFTYLSNVISKDATISKDLDSRLSKTNSSIGRLSKRVWQSHSLCLSTKIQVYRAVIIPTLLYGAETWVPTLLYGAETYWKQIMLLERFHQCCLHSILGIKWQDHVLNEEILKRASLPSIESNLLQVQLCWAGHIKRVEGVRMPKAGLLQRAPRRKA